MRSAHAAVILVAVTLLPQDASARPKAKVTYVHHDVFGSTLARTDAAGAVVWTARPEPSGEVTPSSESERARYANKLGEYDWASEGVAYPMGARLYLPYLGRFATADPLPFDQLKLVNPQSFNRYAYALNNPLRFHDPTGLVSVDALVTIREIVQIVAADAEFRMRLSGDSAFGGEWFWPGGTSRNVFYQLTRQGKTMAGSECNGISEHARDLIGLAVSEGRLGNIELVGTIEMVPIEHTAFYIKLKSGEEIVLDWHAELEYWPEIHTPGSFCWTFNTCTPHGLDPVAEASRPGGTIDTKQPKSNTYRQALHTRSEDRAAKQKKDK
jgi:RHS repeat-associated protein